MAQAQKTLDMMHQFKDNQTNSGHQGDYAKFEEAAKYLDQMGVNSKITGEFTKDTLASQETMVAALAAQLHIQQQVATLNAADKGNAKLEEAKKDKSKSAGAPNLGEAEQSGVNNMMAIIKAANAQMNADTEQGWRERIATTRSGSAERLAVIDAAIADEEARGMESTGAYRGLLTERVNLARQMAEEEAKTKADAAREAAAQSEKMGQLALASEREQWALYNSEHRTTEAQRADEDAKDAAAETALKMTFLSQQMDALNRGGKEYNNELKKLQDEQAQIAQEGANTISAIKAKAQQQQNSAQQSAEQKAATMTANGLTQSIMGHESWAKMLSSLGNQVVTDALKNSLMVMMGEEKERLSHAKTAAAAAYKDGVTIGGPAGMVLGPVFAAAVFAGVMAFAGGGIVPGVGAGDIVPAMLTPGEAVLPKNLVDRLNTSGGGAQPGHTYNLHVSPTYHVSTIDGDGMQDALDKHTDVLQKHFEGVLRKMNR
jgi:hypothetical protein